MKQKPNLIFYLKLLTLQPVGPLGELLPMQAQVTQKTSDEKTPRL
jgi:hypothetical protein